MTEPWHLLYRRSWWDGTRYSWCGGAWPPDTVEEGVVGLLGPECQACKRAKRKAGK